MDFIFLLVNLFIIILILIRVPNINATSMDIDQNPKFLNPLISFFTSVLLANNVYNHIIR
jgi:hypothetical protein